MQISTLATLGGKTVLGGLVREIPTATKDDVERESGVGNRRGSTK